jgi:hypothetical protein
MSQAQYTRGRVTPPVEAGAFDVDHRSGNPTSEKRRYGRGLSRSGASRPWRLVPGHVARPSRLAKGAAEGARPIAASGID